MDLGQATAEEAPKAQGLIDAQGWGPGPYAGETWWAHEGGTAMGVLRLVDAGGDAYIEDVVVREDLRGNGIGTALMREAMASRDCSYFLVCHDERVAFYQRLGYSEISREELPEAVATVCEAEGELNSDHAHLHHFMTTATTRQ